MTQAQPPQHVIGPARQHASHRALLRQVDDVDERREQRVDAIIVPAAREAHRLLPAMGLAAELDCPLVVLCSLNADAQAVQEIAWDNHPATIAIEVGDVQSLPPLLTAAMLSGTPFARHTDTSLKRNLGLAITRMSGWRNALFLDDDVQGLEPHNVKRAAALLDQFRVVGFENLGFPDNSVVCHANRDTGGVQGTFIGGGAMLFRHSQTRSFFPNIYNEDWFFLLSDAGIVDIAVHGTFEQAAFDPYRIPDRAGQEEFGDTLAEGIFALLDDGQTPEHADVWYWRNFLAGRHALIEEIIQRRPSAGLSRRRGRQMRAKLKDARANLSQIDPELCVRYLDAWRRDRFRWARWIGSLPQGLTIEEALAFLDIKY